MCPMMSMVVLCWHELAYMSVIWKWQQRVTHKHICPSYSPCLCSIIHIYKYINICPGRVCAFWEFGFSTRIRSPKSKESETPIEDLLDFSSGGLGFSSGGLGLSSGGLGFSSRGLGFSSRGLGFSSGGLGFSSVGLGFSSKGLGFSSVGLGFSSEGLGFSIQVIERRGGALQRLVYMRQGSCPPPPPTALTFPAAPCGCGCGVSCSPPPPVVVGRRVSRIPRSSAFPASPCGCGCGASACTGALLSSFWVLLCSPPAPPVEWWAGRRLLEQEWFLSA